MYLRGLISQLISRNCLKTLKALNNNYKPQPRKPPPAETTPSVRFCTFSLHSKCRISCRPLLLLPSPTHVQNQHGYMHFSLIIVIPLSLTMLPCQPHSSPPSLYDPSPCSSCPFSAFARGLRALHCLPTATIVALLLLATSTHCSTLLQLLLSCALATTSFAMTRSDSIGVFSKPVHPRASPPRAR